MSYNGYNQYSPYWQQSAGQANPQNSGQNAPQSRPSYQPLSAYQNNQQIAQSSINQSAENSGGTSYGSQGYGNVAMNGAGNGRSHSSYSSVDDRASLDGATALGNLAYASSLGRDGNNYNRQQSNSSYGTANPYGTSAGRYPREDKSTRAQHSTASPSFGYSSNNTAYQGPSAGSSIQTQSQYPSSHSSSEQQRNTQYSQPPRPTSGQAIKQPLSRAGSRAAPSPTTTYSPSIANQSQSRNDGGDVRGLTQTRVQTPQLSLNRPQPSKTSGPSGGEYTQKPQERQDTRDKGVKQTGHSATETKAAAKRPSEGLNAERNNKAIQSPIVDGNQQASKPTTPVEPQYTTVDPSQVFNHAEYSRRQAAAAAEAVAAKKAAEEKEAVRLASIPKPSQINETSAAPPGPEPDSATKEQIELEMKQMIEKMRDYKAKDPSLFTQIWEQVKKSQPPQRAPSQSLQGSTSSPVALNGQLPDPSLIQNQFPSESDLLANGEFPPNFDRGRFPAQRRRRGGGMKASQGRKSDTPNNHTKKISQTEDAEDQRTPVPPELAIPPKVGQIFPDPKSQSMEEATKQFNENSQSSVVPGPNAQAMTSASTRPQTTPPSTTARSQPVQAQSAPPLKPGGTYWPENKKEALAEAARIALTSTAPNRGKPITTREIHELLDQNPSYIQMCEILEYRGFLIDRVQFARTLLKAVPDLGSASSQANAASTSSVSTNNATSTNAPTPSDKEAPKDISTTSTAGVFGKLIQASANDLAPQSTIPQPLPYSAPLNKVSQTSPIHVSPYHLPPARGYRFVDPMQWAPKSPHPYASDTKQGWHDPSHQPIPVYQQPGPNNGQVIDQSVTQYPNGIVSQPTKQETARKRTFGEIVDLTTLSEEEDFERRGPGPGPRTDYRSGVPEPGQVINNMYDPVALSHQSGTHAPKPFKYKYSGRDALLQSNGIVQPMNQRRDALRRSTYNPKTIARDFLLAIGKHPSLAPLNAHLDVLRDRFKAVDHESDLSTFRWDLVDPEGAPNMRSNDTDDEEAVPPIRAEHRERPAPMAVMINNGVMVRNDQTSHQTGPHGKKDMRLGEQNGFGDTTARQSSKNLPYPPPHTQDWSKASGNGPSADFSRFAYNGPPPPVRTNVTTPNKSDSSTPGTTPRRVGRPPGAKNKQPRPDKGVPKKPKTVSADVTPSAAQARPPSEESWNKTPLGSSSIEKPTAPVPTRPRINTTTPSRPSGLKNSISAITPTNGIAVIIPSRSPSAVVTPQASSKKGRPTTAEQLSYQSSPPPAPAYTVYRCRWENCPAELHNLETLKKHVKKHCRSTDGMYPCLWVDCFDSSNPISNSSQSGDGEFPRLKFKTDDEWIAHVESSHLRTERDGSVAVPDDGSVGAKSDEAEETYPE